MHERAPVRLWHTTFLLCVAGLVLPISAAELGSAAKGGGDQSSTNSTSQSEILELKSQLLEQRRMIEQLRLELEEQRKLIGRAEAAGPIDMNAINAGRGRARSTGEVASAVPVVPGTASSANPPQA